MINWTEKGVWLVHALEDAGIRKSSMKGVVSVFPVEREAEAQVIIDNFDPLPFAKAEKIKQLKVEAANRAGEIYAFIVDEDENGVQRSQDAESVYDFAADLYLSVLPAARDTLRPRLQAFKVVHDVAVAAIADINAMTDWESVMAYDVVNAPGWT